MQKQNLFILLSVLQSLLLSGCTSVPDVPVCAEIELNRGFCTFTVRDEDFFIDDQNKFEGKTWWEMRPLMMRVPPSSYAKVKAAFIKQCKKHKDCDKDIAKWERKFEAVEKHLEKEKSATD